MNTAAWADRRAPAAVYRASIGRWTLLGLSGVTDDGRSKFPVPIDRLVATVASVLDSGGRGELAHLLRVATPYITESGRDFGTSYYTLTLELPVPEYAGIESRTEESEQSLRDAFQRAIRRHDSHHISAIVIAPSFDDASAIALTPPSADIDHIWQPGMFRLFMSHVSKYKEAVGELSRKLRVYGVSGFVAHVDIKISEEWRGEILSALASMDAMTVILTPGFHESSWTDQEFGFALGRRVVVIPIMIGTQPYGFLERQQGMHGDLAQLDPIVAEIVDTLLRRRETKAHMRRCLVTGLERADSYAEARMIAWRITSRTDFAIRELERIESSILANRQVRDSVGPGLRKFLDGLTIKGDRPTSGAHSL